MRNGWTGGQYSAYRAILGLYLLGRFLGLAPGSGARPEELPGGFLGAVLGFLPSVLDFSDAPWFPTAVARLAAPLGLLLALGWFDRASAAILLYLGACLAARDPSIAGPSSVSLAWLLVVHLLSPPAPYGSWAARRRLEPGGEWRLPGPIYGATWILNAALHGYWLHETAGLIVASVLALVSVIPRLRLALWIALLAAHPVAGLLQLPGGLGVPLLLLQALAFNPAWVPPVRPAAPATLYYDGTCGLCHRWVRFVLAEDRRGEQGFRFSPLGGARFLSRVPEPVRLGVPDSIVIETADKGLLHRSAGVLHVLGQLGGLWRVLGRVAELLPAPLLDRLYDGVASVRHRLFRRPEDTCPTVSAELRKRFDP
jgi:predicted DCC family thiol-disulfide oxidoreductase YuxK